MKQSAHTALLACVTRMKEAGLTGKLRDDAAGHFLAGARASGLELEVAEPVKYVDVLEALATTPAPPAEPVAAAEAE